MSSGPPRVALDNELDVTSPNLHTGNAVSAQETNNNERHSATEPILSFLDLADNNYPLEPLALSADTVSHSSQPCRRLI